MRFHIVTDEAKDVLAILNFPSQKLADNYAATLHISGTTCRAQLAEPELPQVGQVVYNAKYAIGKGILEQTVTQIFPGRETSTLIQVEGLAFDYFRLHEEVFLTKGEAIQKAYALKEKRRKSLLQSIARLDKITFE